jgi:hypothetical protein
MAINEFNHRQVACKIVPLIEIREKYGACEAAKYKFGPSDRPSPAKKVNHKTELLKLLSLKKRTILAAELAEKLKAYEREVEILQSLNHVRLSSKYDPEILLTLEAKHHPPRESVQDERLYVSIPRFLLQLPSF